jgi:deoxyribose-phosphate aldolase
LSSSAITVQTAVGFPPGGTQARLADRQRALEQGAGTVQVALVAQDQGEVVEALGGAGVVVRRRASRSLFGVS